MKEIKAVIQPFMLDKVLSALHQIPGLPGCIVSRIETHGKPAVGEENRDTTAKVKLEIVVADALVGNVVSAIQKHAHTGNRGDGKIFVINVADVIAIRSGERGEKAL